MTFADKTNNLYRLSKDQYCTLLRNSITSIYIKKQTTKSRRKSMLAEEKF